MIVKTTVADESQPAALINPVVVYDPEVVCGTPFQVNVLQAVTGVEDVDELLIVKTTVADESQPAALVNPVDVYVPEVVCGIPFQVNVLQAVTGVEDVDE